MSYEIKCINCEKLVNVKYPNTKLCSTTCRRERYLRNNDKKEGISTGTVGAISELLVSSDLMLKGFAVFRALSQSCFCDLIAVKNGSTLKVEVKTGYQNEVGKIHYGKSFSENIDLYGVCESKSRKIYYFTTDGNQILL